MPSVAINNVTSLRVYGPTGSAINVTSNSGNFNISDISFLMTPNVASGLTIGDGTECFDSSTASIDLDARL